MSKISIEEIESVLQQRKVPNAGDIIKDLEDIIAELQAEREANKEEKPKYEYVVVLHDPTGKLITDKYEEVVSAFVVQQEEGQDSGTILSKILDATKEQNESAKQKRSRLQNLREIFDGLKSKYLKEKKVKIKTKEPVRVIITNGNIGSSVPASDTDTE